MSNILFRLLCAAALAVAGGCSKSQGPTAPVTVIAKGVQVTGPGGWLQDASDTDAGEPISFNNFHGGYGKGGTRPAGGADINVTTVPMPQIAVDELITRDLAGAEIVSNRPIVVGGKAGTRIAYKGDYGNILQETTVAVYVAQGATLYKFFLNYYPADDAGTGYESAFDSMLANLVFSADGGTP